MMLTPVQKVAPISQISPVSQVSPVAKVSPGTSVRPHTVLNNEGDTFRRSQPEKTPSLYNSEGLLTSGSKTSGVCRTCSERKYQDESGDIGVSFKSATNVSPSAAAGAVMGHEREHESRALQEGRETGANVDVNIRIYTDICPECHKIYVSGGVTNTRVSSPSQAMDAYNKQADGLLDMLSVSLTA